MSQLIPELDDPFDLAVLLEDTYDSPPIVSALPSSPPNALIVTTPCGDEIVPFHDLEDPTIIIRDVELAALLADSSPHTHKTVPSFHAVKPVT